MLAARKPIGELLEAVPRQPKIKRSEYQENGRFPIVDQSQADIAGYTDDDSWLYQGELPVVVFGDHTRVLKFVDFPFCVGADGTQLLRPSGDNDIRFFYYALRNVGLTNYGYERHFKYLKEEQIPVPPPPVQRKIAGVLAAYDELIENNTRRIRLLEQMAQVLYHEWFVRPCHSGKLPKGWETTKLQSLIALDKGVSYNGAGLTDDGNPMVNLKNILPGGGFRRDATKPYSGDFKPRHTVQPGDIILANTDLTQAGNVVASPAFIPRIPGGKPILITHHLYAVRVVSEKVSTAWLYGLFLTDDFRGFAKGYAIGTTVLGLPREAVLDYELALPPEDTIRRYTEVAQPMYELVESLYQRNDTLRRTRDFLLPKLISGDVDVENIEVN